MKKFTLNREDTALVIIDIQERLAAAMRDRERTIANNKILLSAAETLGLPVIATEQYPKGLGRTVPELLGRIDERNVFAKTSFNACFGDIARAVKDTGRTSVLVTGMETHVCVFQTVRALVEGGYSVHVARDAVASRTKENYENGLALMQALGAVITNTETAVFDLLKEAGTPEFKTMSALIK